MGIKCGGETGNHKVMDTKGRESSVTKRKISAKCNTHLQVGAPLDRGKSISAGKEERSPALGEKFSN